MSKKYTECIPLDQCSKVEMIDGPSGSFGFRLVMRTRPYEFDMAGSTDVERSSWVAFIRRHLSGCGRCPDSKEASRKKKRSALADEDDDEMAQVPVPKRSRNTSAELTAIACRMGLEVEITTCCSGCGAPLRAPCETGCKTKKYLWKSTCRIAGEELTAHGPSAKIAHEEAAKKALKVADCEVEALEGSVSMRVVLSSFDEAAAQTDTTLRQLALKEAHNDTVQMVPRYEKILEKERGGRRSMWTHEAIAQVVTYELCGRNNTRAKVAMGQKKDASNSMYDWEKHRQAYESATNGGRNLEKAAFHHKLIHRMLEDVRKAESSANASTRKKVTRIGQKQEELGKGHEDLVDYVVDMDAAVRTEQKDYRRANDRWKTRVEGILFRKLKVDPTELALSEDEAATDFGEDDEPPGRFQ